MIYRFFAELGAYWHFLRQVFRRPERIAEYRKAFWRDVDALGVKTLPLVAIISLFMGAVVTIQTALNLEDPLIPRYYIAIAVRESILLEFAPTIVSLILAGIVGSNISGSLGNMRITEQIDALEVMGINPAGFLVLPKIAANVLFSPILLIFSMAGGLVGGYLAGWWLGLLSPGEFLLGLRLEFQPFYIAYSVFKMTVFAFFIASVSSFFGYRVKGGPLEVGHASTQAVISTILAIILFNYILTDLILQ